MTAANQSSTFLFTDIEGSTRLWSRFPAAMATAVQRQESLLRQIIGEHGGSVFKSVGDGVYAVFPQPATAVRAAVAAQRRLLAEPWDGFEEQDPLLVRIAVHTGAAEARAGDYFGPVLNRLGRTLAAGHGGQVLCTDDTLAACGEDWPEGIGWRDLGERTLRDVPGSGRIFQLVAEGLPEHFPPLVTLDPRVHNLPRWPAPMVGRVADAERLRSALRARETRIVTVLGTGGVGKTRLTTEVAEQLLDEFQDGIRFVDLSALRDDAQVAPAIVQATGAADPLLAPKVALLEWLRNRELLLVLDNCEQVVDGAAELCSEIVLSCPEITILATSRSPLRIRGERQLALEPLPLPGEGPEPAIDNPAVRLFAARARDVNEAFALDEQTAGDVGEICRIVDGLPLAIELAAAWVRVLSPAALQRRLQENRAILRDGARDLPDRQRTLATTIAWSYDLLEPEDQRAFRRLAVFRGGIAVDAAAAVIWEAPITDPLWALTRLDALVQANLLQVAPDSLGEPRFLMLQTIQEFALGVLRASSEWDDAASAHAEFFAGLAAEAEKHYGSENVAPWFDRLDLDFENLRAAIEFSATKDKAGDFALQTVLALAGFLDQRGHTRESRQWLTLTYRDDTSYPVELRIAALIQMGHNWHSNPKIASRHYQRAIELADKAAKPHLGIRAVAALSTISVLAGHYTTAMAAARDVLVYGESTGNSMYKAMGYFQIAHVACESGRFPEGLAACKKVRSFSVESEDPDGEAWGWLIEGRIHRRLHDTDKAIAALDRAMIRFTQIDDAGALGLCHIEYGLVLLDADLAASRHHLDIAIEAFAENYDAYSIIGVLEAAAQLLVLEENHLDGATVFGVVQRLRAEAGIVPLESDAVLIERRMAQVKSQHGTAAFDSAVERGRLLALRGAIDIYRSTTLDPAPAT